MVTTSQTFSSVNTSEVTRFCTVVFGSIAIYNALELMFLILFSFKRYNSLYFRSLLTSTFLGVIPTSIGNLLMYLNLAPRWLTFSFAILGFYCMVPGQSVVLYSRLHLVSQNDTLLRFVRNLVFINTVLLVIPMTILNAGWTFIGSPAWDKGYDNIERVQIAWFSAQETLISTIYIVETIRLLRIRPSVHGKRRNVILYELVVFNLVAISMDVSLTVLEYLNFYFIQVILKALVYSIKLKLEFAVLGKLVCIVSRADGILPAEDARLDVATSNV